MQLSVNDLIESAKRWQSREAIRLQEQRHILNKDIAKVETSERILKRTQHLIQKSQEPKPIISNELRSNLEQTLGLERILGNDDTVRPDFFEMATAVSRYVGRIKILDSRGKLLGYGTGFMVSPKLMMTNNHVLQNQDEATFARIQFDYQIDRYGNELKTCEFELEPENFFLTSKPLDYTLVAVSDTSVDGIEVVRYGWNRLMGEGKIYKGDRVNIVQHPRGQHKKVAVRNNQLVDLLDVHFHYLTDTEPGSSGSPVFNDDWEVVALHHSAVPAYDGRNIISVDGRPWERRMGTDKIKWVANEGIRISRILNHVNKQVVPLSWEVHLENMVNEVPPHPIEVFQSINDMQTGEQNLPVQNAGNTFQWTIPLNISVSVGEIVVPNIRVETPTANGALPVNGDIAIEKKKVPYMDPDYTTRKGYDEHFLGKKVVMPGIVDSELCSKMEDGNHIIPYHHFSVVMNKRRRLAYLTASNVDASKEAKRPEPGEYGRKGLAGFGKNDREMWLVDDRIPGKHQLPDRFYNKDRKAFDKGHIVRRDDVAWGKTYEEVRVSNGDTFHVTNCSPQVLDFNRSREGGIWGKLENFVLKAAKSEKLVVFSGPVFDECDPEFDGTDDYSKRITVKIPRGFWKVIVSNDEGKIKSYAFYLEQDFDDVQFTDPAREIVIPDYWTQYMLPMTELQEKLENITLSAQLKKSCQFDVLTSVQQDQTA